jgi:uncharacterized protein
MPSQFLPGQIAHFAINANDIPRAQRFYGAVFGWKFLPYGPPGFFMIDNKPSGELRGSMQQRREIVKGVAMHGLECTVAVADIHATEAAIKSNGGAIVMPVCTLTGIGQLLFFQDPEGNILGAMQYDDQAD